MPFPAQRSMGAVCVGTSIYLFAGVGKQGSESILDVSSDLWRFDTDLLAWQEIPATGSWPSPRRCAGMCAVGSRILVWGGSGVRADADGVKIHSFLDDMWSFDTVDGTWTCEQDQTHGDDPASARPSPRYFPVFKPTLEGQMLFGGYTEDCLGHRNLRDTWVLTGRHWTRLDDGSDVGGPLGAPVARYGAMSASVGADVYLFGGHGQGRDLADLWMFDGTTRTWELVDPGTQESSPSPRYAGAFGAYGSRLFLFGGRSRLRPKVNHDDLWSFDLQRGSWELIESSPGGGSGPGPTRPGYHAKPAYCTQDRYLWMHGGEGTAGHVSDFWRLDMGRARWDLVQNPRDDDPAFW